MASSEEKRSFAVFFWCLMTGSVIFVVGLVAAMPGRWQWQGAPSWFLPAVFLHGMFLVPVCLSLGCASERIGTIK